MSLCLSYNRLDISTEIANTVCQKYEQDDAVVPPKLRQGVFTTAAVDNIDHNPSSTTGKTLSMEQVYRLCNILSRLDNVSREIFHI